VAVGVTRLGRSVGLVLAVLAAALCGYGWLYLLRDARALDAGPQVPGALALQRLARTDAQPLLRVLVAWVPAGLVVGLAAARLGALGRVVRALLAGALTYVTVVLLTAGADSVTHSDRLSQHLSAQFGRAAALVPAAVVAACAALLRSSRADVPPVRPGRRVLQPAARRQPGGGGARRRGPR
jgi:hypothetical protein